MQSMGQGYTELFNISYNALPLRIKNTNPQDNIKCNEVKMNANVPIIPKHDSSYYFFAGINYSALTFNGNHPEFPIDHLYSISLLSGITVQLHHKVDMTTLLSPFVNIDRQSSSQNSDIHFAGIFRLSYKIKSNLTIKTTIGYRKQYYGPQYILFIGADWKISDKLYLSGDLPNNATLNYKLNSKMSIGMNMSSGNTSYRLSRLNEYMLYSYTQPGIYYDQYIVKNILAVRATVAYSIQRNMDIYRMDQKVDGVIDHIILGTKPEPINAGVNKGASYKLSLSLRVQDKKSR